MTQRGTGKPDLVAYQVRTSRSVDAATPGRGRRRRGRRAKRRPTTGAAAAAAVVVAALAASGGWSRFAFAAAIFAAQLGLVVGWLRLMDLPGKAVAAVIGIGAALVVDGVLLVRVTPDLRHVAPVLSAAVLAAVAHQLARRGPGRGPRGGTGEQRGDEPAVGAAVSCCGAVLAVLAAGWLAVPAAGAITTTMLAAVGAAALWELVCSALRLPRAFATVGAVVGGVGAAVAVADRAEVVGLAAGLSLTTAAAVGAASGALATVAFAVVSLSRRYASDSIWFAATLPVAVVGPAAYFLGRLLGG